MIDHVHIPPDIQALVAEDIENFGNAFVEVRRDSDGQILSYTYIPAATVKISDLKKFEAEGNVQTYAKKGRVL